MKSIKMKMVMSFLGVILLGVLFYGSIILGITKCSKKVSEKVSKEDVQQGIATGVVKTKKFFKEIGEEIKKLEEKETQ